MQKNEESRTEGYRRMKNREEQEKEWSSSEYVQEVCVICGTLARQHTDGIRRGCITIIKLVG